MVVAAVVVIVALMTSASVAHGAAGFFGSPAGATRAAVVGMASTPDGGGYWIAAEDGSVFAYGNAGARGSAAGRTGGSPVVDIAAAPDGGGYWLVTAAGGVFSFGSAPHLGAPSRLNQPIVGMASTPDGRGYWLVASDGGVFSYGTARFFGSTGSIRLNQPIRDLAPTPAGDGYWMVATDGGIFAFGAARFFGSTGNIKLNQPIKGMTPTRNGDGYWLVASDGGIFAFGAAPFYGSAGAIRLNQPITSMAAVPDGSGYWLVARDGGIFTYSGVAAAAPPAVTNVAPVVPVPPPTVSVGSTLVDGFDGLGTGWGWTDGSLHGAWRSVYNGYGSVGIEDVGGNRVLAQKPQASTSLGETHAGLVVTQQHFGDSDITVRMQTVRQLRTPTPNPWETAWLAWNYTHDESFYYLALKTNGWELGKVDASKVDPNGPRCYWPSYVNCKYAGAQRFLATGTNVTFPAGAWNTARVRQVGGTIEAWANGQLLVRFVDTENVYRSGSVGLYNEDAHVRFDDVRVVPAI